MTFIDGILRFFLGEASDGGWSSVRRAVSLAGVLMAMGTLAIIVAGLFAGSGSRVSFIFIGLLTAMAAAAAGAILGMVFGVPESVTRGATAASESEEWFADNSSLERIAAWLTGAIIALTFVNFEQWLDQFNRSSRTIGCAMLALDPCRGDGVHAGAIMAAYGFLGFIAGYLATRRYLPRELARARADQRGIVRDDESARLKAKAASAAEGGRVAQKQDSGADGGSGTVATSPEAMAEGQLTGLAHATADAIAAQTALASRRHQEAVVEANPDNPGDPWAGRFGGSAIRDGFQLGLGPEGIVPHPSLADYFLVDLCIRPLTDEAAKRGAGRPVRIYLHPTFGARQIATYQLDSEAMLSLPLAAWGAFTVGAQLLLDHGALLLELDLAAVPTAPALFAAR